MISNTCKYAIRAVVYLAVNAKEHKIGIKQIAKELDIPSPFLGKILQTLAKQKLLTSTKGPHGGFGIGKNPDEIKLIDIVEIIDGLDVFNTCLVGVRICQGDEAKKDLCPFHNKSNPVRQKLKDLFEKQSIGEFANDLDRLNEPYLL